MGEIGFEFLHLTLIANIGQNWKNYGCIKKSIVALLQVSKSKCTLLPPASAASWGYTGCPKKNYTLFWRALAPLNFELGIKVRGVLEFSCSQLQNAYNSFSVALKTPEIFEFKNATIHTCLKMFQDISNFFEGQSTLNSNISGVLKATEKLLYAF